MESQTESRTPQPEHLQVEGSAAAPAVDLTTPQPEGQDSLWDWPDGFVLDIAHATRTWIQYGVLGFAVACIVIGAIKGVIGL